MNKEHLNPNIESAGSKYLDELQRRINSASSNIKDGIAFSREFKDMMALGPTENGSYNNDPVVKEALQKPDILKGLVAKKGYYTLVNDLIDAKKRIEDKLVTLPTKINDVELKKIEKALGGEAVNLKRLITVLNDPDIRKRMLEMEKRSHGLGDEFLIGNKTVSSIDFLTKLSNKKLSILQLGRMYPMIMKIIMNRGYFVFKSYEQLKRFEITKTSLNTDIVRSPFGSFFVNDTITNLHKGSIEEDLVLLKISDESLFDAVWSTLSEAISNNASEKANVGTDRTELIEIKGFITKAAKKLIDYQAGGPPDRTNSNPARPTGLTPEQEARRTDLIRLTSGHNPRTEIPLLTQKMQTGIITPEEQLLLSQLTELQGLHDEKLALSQNKATNDAYLKQQVDQQKKIALEAKREELQKIKLPSMEQLDEIQELTRQIDELDANEPFYDKQMKMALSENQKKMLKFLGDSVYENMRKSADTLTGTEKNDEKDIAFWSQRFIQSCHSIQTYLTDFYKPLIESEKEKARKNHDHHSHDAHHEEGHDPEHDIAHTAAIAAEKKMQTIISSIITSTLSPVIEAGGEPSQDFAHQEGHLAFQSQPPRNRLHIIMRALTRLKMEGARLKELPPGLTDLPFVNSYRKQNNIWDPKERRNTVENFGRVQHEVNNTAGLFHKHARDLEEFFEVFFLDIIGSNDIRAQITAGKDFYKEVHAGKLNQYSLSKQFDTINNSDIGPEIAATLPTCKTILMSYFAEKGWLTDEELESDLSSPKGYLNTKVGDFMKSYYPNYSANKRNMITYIAVKQAYLHSMYQLTLSNTRYRYGFSGGKHTAGNMYFNDQVMSDKFAGSLAQFDIRETIDHKSFAKGALFAPSGGKGKTAKYRGFDAVQNMNATVIENFNDVLYGGIMYDLSGEYGLMLKHFHPNFENNLPDALQPQNRFRNGSDENLRGWRQLKKSKDNVSHILYTYGSRKDWVIANNSYTDNDHFTLIWKSVENLGTNYLRTWTQDLMLGKYHEGKFRDLNKYLYRRYFQNTQLGGVDFGSKILSDMGFSSISSDDDFANQIHHKILSVATQALKEDPANAKLKMGSPDYKIALDKSLNAVHGDILNDVFYHAHMVLMAERTPTVFMDATTPWSEQTGVTLLDEIKTSILSGKANGDGHNLSTLFEAESTTDSKNGKFVAAWEQAKNDLLFIQQNARKSTSQQIKDKREGWENKSAEKDLDSNTFGDFTQDYSDIELVPGSNKKGYIITDEFIKAKLAEHYASLDPSERDKRINRVLAMRKLSLSKMLETPELPSYAKIRADIETRLNKSDKSVSEAERNAFKARILANIGNSEAEYREKHAKKLLTRSRYFMDSWRLSELVFEPEADAAENFMRYENADVNHIGRMAGITEVTSVKSKADLAYDAETSINEAVKNWAKDPIKAIDTMAEYLNKYRHNIEDERGSEFSIDYVGWYVNRVLQLSLKEEKYRGGLGGAWRDTMALIFNKNRTSFGGMKNQPFTSQSLSALKTHEAIRYLIQKKLIGPDQGNAYMRRYRATYGDIFKELAPRVGVIALGALAVNLFTTAVQKDSNLKSSH